MNQSLVTNDVLLNEEQIRTLLDVGFYVPRWATGNRDTSKTYNVFQKKFHLDGNSESEIKGWYQCSWCGELRNLLVRRGTAPLLRHIERCAQRPNDYVLPDRNTRVNHAVGAAVQPAVDPSQPTNPAAIIASASGLSQTLDIASSIATATATTPSSAPASVFPPLLDVASPIATTTVTTTAPSSAPTSVLPQLLDVASQIATATEPITASIAALPITATTATTTALTSNLLHSLVDSPIVAITAPTPALPIATTTATATTTPLSPAAITAPALGLSSEVLLTIRDLADFSNRLLNIGLFHGSVPNAILNEILTTQNDW